MVRSFMSVFILIFTSIFCYPVDDSYWSNRNSAEGAKEAYEYYKQQYSNEQNYENSWKFARSAHFYADDFLSDQKLKRIIFTEGKMAAERATNLAPDKAEGHYYLAICYGSWAELNGIFNGLSAADLIIKEATTVINIDPSYEDGAGYILRGRVYQEAPGIISVGDWKKAQDDYEKALKISPNNRLAYRFYAELLMATDKKKAKELIMQGLDIPLDQANSYDDESEIKNLKELLKKL